MLNFPTWMKELSVNFSNFTLLHFNISELKYIFCNQKVCIVDVKTQHTDKVQLLLQLCFRMAVTMLGLGKTELPNVKVFQLLLMSYY